MKIETLRNEDCTATLTVEVDAERVQAALRVAARQVARRYNFPGFRPGKAPYETVLRHVGEKALYEVALEDLGQKIYEEALDQEKLEVSAPGALVDAQMEPAMVLKFNVPLKPDVDLGDYRALRLPYSAAVVDDAAVDKVLEDLRERQAVVEPVERPAEMGDVATCDVKAFINQGENPSDYLMADKDLALTLAENGADAELPGLERQLVGVRAGDEKKFDLTFPEDYTNSSLRGQVAHVEVKVTEVKHRTLPEWNDELAKAVGDFETVAELQQRVRADLQAQAERETNQRYADQVMDQLVAQAAIKYPPVLLDNQLDAMMEDLEQNLQQREHLKLEDYLKIKGQTLEEFRNENRPRAEASLKRSLVLSKVIDAEDLSVEADEVESRMSVLEAQLGGREMDKALRQAIASDRLRSSMALDLLTDKVYERLVALAKGEAVPLPAAAVEALPMGTPVPAETSAGDAPAGDAEPLPTGTPVPAEASAASAGDAAER